MDVASIKRPPSESAQPPRRPSSAPAAPKPEDKPKSPEHTQATQAKPAPVLNGQGHATGRVLNVTA